MRLFILFLASTFIYVSTAVVFAQTVKVGEVDTDEDSTTTIKIQKTKGAAKEEAKSEPVWEVVDGDSELTGDTKAMVSEAKASWKEACDAWKKEFRADNKENKIISMNCGAPACDGGAGQKVCTSKATYKIKTKLN